MKYCSGRCSIGRCCSGNRRGNRNRSDPWFVWLVWVVITVERNAQTCPVQVATSLIQYVANAYRVLRTCTNQGLEGISAWRAPRKCISRNKESPTVYQVPEPIQQRQLVEVRSKE